MPSIKTIDLSTFDAFAWFKGYIKASPMVTESDMRGIRDFVLMWSLFEREAIAVYKAGNTFDKIKHSVDDAEANGHLLSDDFLVYASFFKRIRDEYSSKEEFMLALCPPGKSDSKTIQKVRQFVDDKANEPNNLVLALLLIVFRIRNNAFHGGKESASFRDQDAVFRASNSLLALYLDKIGRVRLVTGLAT